MIKINKIFSKIPKRYFGAHGHEEVKYDWREDPSKNIFRTKNQRLNNK